MPARSAPANSDAPSRYTVYGEIASGGMATIQYGRLTGAGGFSRDVAIKRLHPHFAKDESFVSMFLDEARLSARIAHANVAQTYDVIATPDELSVVMEYVHGESLASLFEHAAARGERMPVPIAVTLLTGILHGLHAAHETRGEHGEPLHIIHRDVSPENILVGVDGVARLIDFGIARARGRSRATPAGQLKGKLAYLACEQYRGGAVDRRVDIYGAAVVLWEALAGRLLFTGDSDAALVASVLHDQVLPPSRYHPAVPEALDRIVMRGIARDPDTRHATAREMAVALEREVGGTTQSVVSDWLEHVAGETLTRRAEKLAAMRTRAAVDPATEPRDVGSTRPIDRSTLEQPAREETLENKDGPTVPSAGSFGTKSGFRERPGLRRSARLVTALGLLALAAVLFALWLWRWDTTPPSATVRPDPKPAARANPPPAASGKPPSLPEPRVEPTARPMSAPTPGQETDLAPSTEATATTAPDAGAPAPGSDRGRSPKGEPRDRSERSGTADSADRKVDCRRPFVVDKRGIRHVKPECLD